MFYTSADFQQLTKASVRKYCVRTLTITLDEDR